MATIPEAWVSKVKELLKGEIFTADKPGKWAGKEGSHVPVAARNNEGSIDLKVPHVMNKGEIEEDDHWIEWVFATDAAGEVIACQKFAATDDEAKITFVHPEGKTLSIFGYCNKHGLWQGADL